MVKKAIFAQFAIVGLLFGGLFLTVIPPVSAAAYYVSKTATNGNAIGTDVNNGTSKSTPFITIKKAVQTVAAGDTVTINDGTYTEIPSLNFDKGVTYNPETALGVTIKGSNVTTLLTQATLTSGTLSFGSIIFD